MPTNNVVDGRSPEEKGSARQRRILMEKRGPVVKKQFIEDIESKKLSCENLVMEMDNRPDAVKVDLNRGEISMILPLENKNGQALGKVDVENISAAIEDLKMKTVRGFFSIPV